MRGEEDMLSKSVEFKYKGSRSYIHGTDMFNMILSGYRAGELHAIRFTVHGFTLKNKCNLFESLVKSDIDELKEAKLRCQYDYNGETHYLALIEDQKLSEERYEYDEGSIVNLTENKGDVLSFLKKSPFSFIETVVAMNKHHLQVLFPDAPGKWAFTRIDMNYNCDNRSGISLVFKHNMNFRLTKSDILVDGEKVGDIYFSLVKS